MAAPRPVRIGSELREFPGGTLNALVEGYYRTLAALGKPDRAGGPGQILVVKAINATGDDLRYGDCVAIEHLAIPFGDRTNQQYARPALQAQGLTPAAKNAVMGVAVGPIASGGTGTFITSGPAWLRCNVLDLAHNHVALDDAEPYSPLAVSAAAGAPIIAREAVATGEKWICAMLGDKDHGRVVLAQVVGEVASTDATFEFDTVHGIVGRTPEINGEPVYFDEDELVTLDGLTVYITSPHVATNFWDDSFTDGEWVFLFFDQLAGIWIPHPKPKVLTVYEFANCNEPTRRLYVTNPECGDHLPDTETSPLTVAVISTDEAAIECWQLVGVAAQCRSGVCVDILLWLADCESCGLFCYDLEPCDAGTTYRVCGPEWTQYANRVVVIDAVCYSVTPAGSADGADESITVDMIQDVLEACDECDNCYEIQNCFDVGDVRYIRNNLVEILGLSAPASAVGVVIRFDSLCYTVTAYQEPCSEASEFVESEITQANSCDNCCYDFTPCAGSPGGCTAFKVRQLVDDPNLPAGTTLEDLLGKVVRLDNADDCCYTVARADNCASASDGLPAELIEVYDDCAKCAVTRWKLCSSPFTIIRTYADLSAYYDPNPEKILKRAEDGLCYERLTPTGSETIVDFTVEDSYDTCECCADPRYKLTPACGDGCEAGCTEGGGSGGGTVIVTDSDLQVALGRIVKVRGQCYSVSCTTDAVTETLDCWQGPFASCAECLDANTRMTFVVKEGDEIKGVILDGPFRKCGEEVVAEECDAEAIAPNLFAFQSLI